MPTEAVADASGRAAPAPGSGDAEARAGGRRLAHQPALDGLRAVSVTAVLLFHAGVPHVTGGYVGVSVFFTLSGFLITTLLIRERDRTGTVSASAFYARRARRLLPASTLCLAGVAALAVAGAYDQVPHLRRDLAGAALQVENWVSLFSGGSYADLFAQAGGQVNPVAHYWSLAIEEQFYWLWPISFLGLAALARRGGRSLVVVLGAVTLFFVAAGPVIGLVWGPDAAYWATPARVGEILTGALAAAIVAAHGAPAWCRRAAPWCLAAIAAACVTFPVRGGPAYAGWLPALSVVTAVLLVGLQHDGPVRSGLSWRPLVALCAISYGVYLYHWPIFTILDEARVGHGGVLLLVIRLGATLAAAIVSYRLLERPVRRWPLSTRRSLLGGVALVALSLAFVLVVPSTGTSFDTAGDASAVAAIDPDARVTPLPTTSVPGGPLDAAEAEAARRQLVFEAPTPPRPVRILVVGDSTAEATGGGLVRWAAAHPDLAQVSLATKAGCGFVQGGTRVFPEGDQEISAACDEYVDETIPAKVADLRPDVVVAMTTAWDVINQRFPGTEAEAPTDPEYADRIERDLDDATQAILDAGAPEVVWIAEPTVNPIWNPAPSPQEEPERHDVLHATMRGLAEADPQRVAVADLAWWIDAAGLAEDREARPDGVHLSASAAERVATDWLGPVVLDVALGR